jgi:hypothetical protein
VEIPKVAYETPVLIDAVELAAGDRPERVGVCGTGGSALVHEDD